MIKPWDLLHSMKRQYCIRSLYFVLKLLCLLNSYYLIWLPNTHTQLLAEIKDISISTYDGIVLVYSTQRQASFAVMKSLITRLPLYYPPKLIVALAANGSHEQILLDEGHSLSRRCKAMFAMNTTKEETLSST